MPSPAHGTEGVLGKRGRAPRAFTHVRSPELTLTQETRIWWERGWGGILRREGFLGQVSVKVWEGRGGLAEHFESLRNYLFRKGSKPFSGRRQLPIQSCGPA